jgi:glycosidase
MNSKNRVVPFVVVAILAVSSIINHAVAAPNTASNSAWNVNINPVTTNPAAFYGVWSNHTYYASPSDWRKESIYQFITDRFSDGDPSNNDDSYGGYDLAHVDTRHGGDFKGIQDNLDYIKSLGYTAIWISPIFQNRYNSYHGYGQIDFTLLDDRFGTLTDFRNMVIAAHNRGIKVIVDIVVNHMSDLLFFGTHTNDSAPFRFHSGEYDLSWRNPSETYTDFVISNNYSSSGTYCDVYDSNGYKQTDSGAGSYWWSDFHHNGDLTDYGDAWNNHLGKIYGALDDLRTSHPRVQDKIIAMTKALIASTDIDGIRMDTPMQVPLYCFKRWTPAITSYATSLGKSNFFVFGEFYCSRGRAATMVGRGKDPTMTNNPNAFIDSDYCFGGGVNYDLYFSFFGPAVHDQTNGNLHKAKDMFDSDKAYDFYEPLANEVRYKMCNFYDNHDQWRMSTATDGFSKTDLGSAIIAFWMGIPTFYYGDEQGFCSNGSALDGTSREDMMTSLAWTNISAVVSPNPAISNNFDMCSSHYQYVQKCMNIRKQYDALQNTDENYERWTQSNAWNGIYAYSRAWGNVSNWAMIVWNTWSGSVEAGAGYGQFWTGWGTGDKIVNVFNTNEVYTLMANGQLSNLWVNGYETKVFVRQPSLKPLNPVVTSVTPAHDQVVTNSSMTITLKFSEPMDAVSVRSNFLYDGSSIATNRLTYDSTARTLSFTTNTTDGIHYIEELDQAKSTTNKFLMGSFSSRFRKGASNNIIANPWSASAQSDSSLINNGAAFTNAAAVTLYHKATGAEKFRVRNESASWSTWTNYTSTSSWNLSNGTGAKTVTVQYWADGSGAYFVTDTITRN